MNKKGLVEGIIANVAVLIPILVIMVLFLFASYTLAGFRGGSSLSGSNGFISDSFLLKTITLEGRNVSIAEQMIKDRVDADNMVVPLAAYKDIQLIDTLKNFMISDSIYKTQDSCLYLAVGDPKICIELKKNNNSEISPGSCRSDSPYIASSDQIPLLLNGTERTIYSYYGRCLG